MSEEQGHLPRRFRRLPAVWIGERTVPLATSRRARLLGLAFLRRGRAGDGLLIPRCRSVHTFGMRFALDLRFLDGDLEVTSERRGVRPGRLSFDRRARAVLELPARSACDGS